MYRVAARTDRQTYIRSTVWTFHRLDSSAGRSSAFGAVVGSNPAAAPYQRCKKWYYSSSLADARMKGVVLGRISKAGKYLLKYGIRGDTLKWIKDFLDNRKQAVVINGINSEKIPVSSGVPQGSVLGPILFLAYINDLPEQVKSRVRLFADDTALYLAISSTTESEVLQTDLASLEQWEKMWDMQFNPSKCQVLQITKRQNPSTPSTFYIM